MLIFEKIKKIITPFKKPTNFERTKTFLSAFGKTPNEKDLSTQIGVHFEEVAELFECIEIDDYNTHNMLLAISTALHQVANSVKLGKVKAGIPEGKRVKALDGICDGEVTGNGIAFLAGFNKIEADKRVLDHNDAKWKSGNIVILEGGKAGKPKDLPKLVLEDLV